MNNALTTVWKAAVQILKFLAICFILFILYQFSIANQKAKCQPQANQEFKSVECQINDNITN